jgi:hypothetical protein
MTELPKNINTTHTPPKHIPWKHPKFLIKDEKLLEGARVWVQERMAEAYDF